MISATIMSTRFRYKRASSAATTISLSATGSRNAPNADIWFSRRARKPSSQSVMPAKMNTTVAVTFRPCSDSHVSGR